MTREIAERIVDAIIFDLSDRRGLSSEWSCIDDDIRAEIREEWIALVFAASPGEKP